MTALDRRKFALHVSQRIPSNPRPTRISQHDMTHSTHSPDFCLWTCTRCCLSAAASASPAANRHTSVSGKHHASVKTTRFCRRTVNTRTLSRLSNGRDWGPGREARYDPSRRPQGDYTPVDRPILFITSRLSMPTSSLARTDMSLHEQLKNETLRRINSISETKGRFDSWNSCKWLETFVFCHSCKRGQLSPSKAMLLAIPRCGWLYRDSCRIPAGQIL